MATQKLDERDKMKRLLIYGVGGLTLMSIASLFTPGWRTGLYLLLTIAGNALSIYLFNKYKPFG